MGRFGIGCIGALVILVVATILNGWALMVLWEWFVVPTFGAPVLNFGQALGLGVIVAFLTHQTEQRDEKDRELWEIVAHGLTMAILKPLWALGIGWIYLQFV